MLGRRAAGTTMSKDKKPFRLVDPEGGLPEIYSNHVALGSTRDDIRIRFGQIIPLESQVIDAAFEWPEGFNAKDIAGVVPGVVTGRSEERRVGKECRSR